MEFLIKILLSLTSSFHADDMLFSVPLETGNSAKCKCLSITRCLQQILGGTEDQRSCVDSIEDQRIEAVWTH